MKKLATKHWVLVALALLIVAAATVLIGHMDVRGTVTSLLARVDDMGPAGVALFILAYAVTIVLLVPTVVLTIGAGILYGAVKGTVCVVAGLVVGSTMAFLIARYLFSERFALYLLRHPKLRILDQTFVGEGWKIILLTRLVPMFPGKISNYFFGLARFRLVDFVIGTLFGVIPFTFVNVYVGSLIGNLAALGTGTAPPITPLHWVAYGIGLVVGIGAVVHITRVARRALNRQLSDGEGAQGAQ